MAKDAKWQPKGPPEKKAKRSWSILSGKLPKCKYCSNNASYKMGNINVCRSCKEDLT
jgi:hypothetical protein